MQQERPPRATQRDVAAAAGLSIATVSRALGGRGELSPGTREIVLQAAREVGYQAPETPFGRPPTTAGRLIEFVLGSFDDAWTDAMTAGAREAAFTLGYDLVLTQERPDVEDDWPQRAASRRPAGVVVGIIYPTKRQLEAFRGLRVPIVLLEPRSDPDGVLPSVGTTDWQGGYDAGAHLATSQAERFVAVSGTPRYRFGRAREQGFLAAIGEHRPGAAISHVDSSWTDARVDDALLRALAGDSKVAVFACNDEMALATYRAAAYLRKKIAEDVFVVGFNDEPRAADARPPLTSVRQPLRAIAGRAIELVHTLRSKPSPTYERYELPTELIVRASSH